MTKYQAQKTINRITEFYAPFSLTPIEYALPNDLSQPHYILSIWAYKNQIRFIFTNRNLTTRPFLQSYLNPTFHELNLLYFYPIGQNQSVEDYFYKNLVSCPLELL